MLSAVSLSRSLSLKMVDRGLELEIGR